MRLVLTDAAIADLLSIADWIAQDSPGRALSFVQELKTACFSIVDFPESHPIVPRYSEFNVRRKVHGSYLIFYQVMNGVIAVVHILHGAQDYETILFPQNQP
jgi:toxin ParE1/3/4